MRKWFVSHPSGAFEHTPTFFNALREFAKQAAGTIELILPHGQDEEVDLTKKDIEESELVIVEVSIPSTGSGIELGWASAHGRPIIAFHQGGSLVSPALRFVTQETYAYVTTEDIIKTLQKKK